MANATKRGEKMLVNKLIDELRIKLTMKCGSVEYVPVFFLKKETIPMLEIIYSINNKGYNFTIPLFLFENVDNAKAYESAQEEFIREIKRNVRLAHKREEVIR